jgi:hypothetical protein
MLLEPDVWRGISLDDYVTWANQIWHILMLRASRQYVGSQPFGHSHIFILNVTEDSIV